MLQRLTISGLGPHRDFSAPFNPDGKTEVNGPSESGKSTLIEAVTLCLWGQAHGGRFKEEAITDGMDKAVVEILLDSGRLIRRTITRSRSQTRSITLGDEVQSYSSEKKFSEGLGELGSDPEAMQCVISPFQWVELVSGNARAFRDVLSRILPEGDVPGEVKKLMLERGFDLDDEEAVLSEKDVMKARRNANKARDEASGRLQATEDRIAHLKTMEPTSEGAEPPDPKILDAAREWSDYDRIVGNAEKRKAIEQAQKDWDAKIAALGEEPEWDPVHDEAQGRFQTAQLAYNQSMQAYQQAYAQHQTAQMQMQQFQTTDPVYLSDLPATRVEAGAQYAAQIKQQMEQIQASFEQVTTQYQAAHAELQAATQAVNDAREAASERKSWHDTRKGLGERPVLPPVPDDAPEPPEVERPDPADVSAAQTAIREASSLEGARIQWERNLENARSSAVKERERHGEAAQKAERLNALLDAVREAPSIVAKRQALALGDMGPVSLEFGDNPAVSVLIDGRPWWLASRGRRVVADMFLRAALRRAMEAPWLPIIVDNIQDVGGQPLPELDGPLVLLQTTDAKGISVRRR